MQDQCCGRWKQSLKSGPYMCLLATRRRTLVLEQQSSNAISGQSLLKKDAH
jgi:hypothetical protein